MKETCRDLINKIVVSLIIFAFVFSTIPERKVYAENAITVYFNIAYDGQIVLGAGGRQMMRVPVSVSYFDLEAYGLEAFDNDTDTVTMLHALIRLEEEYDNIANFTVEESSYGGSYVTSFWSYKTGNMMYYINGEYPNGTSEQINIANGDNVDIAMYSAYNSEAQYTYFADRHKRIKTGEAVTVNLNEKKVTYDADWNATTSIIPVNGAKLAISNSASSLPVESEYVTDSDGNATLTFDTPGTYYITPVNTALAITGTDVLSAFAPIEVITVEDIEAEDLIGGIDVYTGTAESNRLTMTPAFSPSVKEYTVEVYDNISTFIIKATGNYGSTIKANYKNTSKVSKSITLTSGNNTNISSFIKKDGVGNKIEIVATLGSVTKTYTINVVRKLTLSDIKVYSGDKEVVLDKAFSYNSYDYRGSVLDTVEAIDIAYTPTVTGKYTITVNGKEASGNARVSLENINNNIPICISYAGTNYAGESFDFSTTYNINVDKVSSAAMAYKVTPDSAIVSVYDGNGNKLSPDSDNGYTYSGLVTGGKYNYVVSCYGYTSKSSSFIAGTTSELDIVLDKSEASYEELDSEWSNFRNSGNNMGVTASDTPKSAEETKLKWEINSGSCSQPIIVDGKLYVTCGDKLRVYSKATGELLKEVTTAGKSAYSLQPPTYAAGMIFVDAGNYIQAFNAKTLESVWISEALEEKIYTPITYRNGYIYAGTWVNEAKNGHYVCISVTDEEPDKTDETKYCTWKNKQMGGFYFAGAYATDKYVIYGGDNGSTAANANSSLVSVNSRTGEIIDKITTIVGDARSAIAYDNGFVYFTSKSGYIYKVGLNSDGSFREVVETNLGGACTATPAIIGNRIYVGVNKVTGGTTSIKVIDKNTMNIIYSAVTPAYSQSSGLIATDGKDYNYVYFTCNSKPGAVYILKDKEGQIEGNVEALYVPIKENYCLSSVVCDKEGTLYYRNDAGYLMALAKNPAYIADIDITGGNGELSDIFNPQEANVEILVDKGTKTIDVKPIVPEGFSVIGGGTIAIDNGAATFTLKVTNDTGATRVYMVNVRERRSVSALSLLSVSCSNVLGEDIVATLPIFNGNIYEYSGTINGSKTTFARIWAKSFDKNANIYVEPISGYLEGNNGKLSGKYVEKNDKYGYYPVYFEKGAKKLTVIVHVIAEDKITKTSYVVNINLEYDKQENTNINENNSKPNEDIFSTPVDNKEDTSKKVPTGISVAGSDETTMATEAVVAEEIALYGIENEAIEEGNEKTEDSIDATEDKDSSITNSKGLPLWGILAIIFGGIGLIMGGILITINLKDKRQNR